MYKLVMVLVTSCCVIGAILILAALFAPDPEEPVQNVEVLTTYPHGFAACSISIGDVNSPEVMHGLDGRSISIGDARGEDVSLYWGSGGDVSLYWGSGGDVNIAEEGEVLSLYPSDSNGFDMGDDSFEWVSDDEYADLVQYWEDYTPYHPLTKYRTCCVCGKTEEQVLTWKEPQ